MTGTRHVLVVDDDADIREIARASLEATAGWRVSTAASGAEALAGMASDPPDVVLLDVMMPGLDGPATLERLSADAATTAIPVIFLTAKVQPAEVRRFARLGVADVIAKPFDPMTLHERIGRVLGWG